MAQANHGQMYIERKDETGTIFVCQLCGFRISLSGGVPKVLADGDITPGVSHNGSNWPGLMLGIGVSQATDGPAFGDALSSAMEAASRRLES